ncbi:uncharacterized protein LOC120652629 [Panicum virgatum]|uniref:uncharacterized protein LOC120652629 n=1 Tax=Panicum virgatum TaxID=38727 RepID=UPI0019D58715|nr:uncharacterized protein LOC120652629 [Panicum virgatum]
MDASCKEIHKLEAHFYGLEFLHVLRDYNMAADVLSKLASKRALISARVFVQALNSPTVKIEEEPPTKPDLAPALGQEAAQGGYTHIFITIDKFTKWIEVKPVSSTSAAKAAEFIEEITHRFGVPNRIIIDLGSSFPVSEFWDFCQESCINVYYASMAHPRCNGQVERANGLILQGLKARIFDPIEKYRSKWIQELPKVVWGLRTQRSRVTGYSPFFMVYGSEAILPTDIAFGAPHTQNYDEGEAEPTR